MCRLPDPDPRVAGRADLVAAIAKAVNRQMRRRGSASAFLFGQPGVGASTVAVEAARRLAPQFPGGVFHIDLHGLVPDARRDVRTVVRMVSEALDMDLGSEGMQDAELLAAFAARLEGRQVLLVLDNALDAAHVAPLSTPPAGCACVVTSRNRVQTSADPGLAFHVPPLARRDAVRVLELCSGRGPGEHHLFGRIARLCADLPLALRIVSARLLGRPDLPLDYLTQVLADETTRLDYLDAGDRAVRAAIRLSYDNLDPEARHLLRLVAAAPAAVVTSAELGHALEAAPLRQELVLNRLVDRSLAELEIVRPFTGEILASFSLFELVLIFAKERLADEEPEETVWDFQYRCVGHLRDRLTALVDQTSHADLSGELDSTRFHAAEQLAEARGWLDLATDLAVGLHVLYSARGELDGVVDINAVRVGLHLRQNRPADAVWAYLLDTDTLKTRGARNLAIAAARNAARIAHEHRLGDLAGQAEFKLSLLLFDDQDLPGALAAGKRAVAELTAAGRQAAAVPVAVNNCTIALDLDEDDEAVELGRIATELAEEWGGEIDVQALASLRRGQAEYRVGRYLPALASARRAETLYVASDWWGEAARACADGAFAALRIHDLATAAELRARAADHRRAAHQTGRYLEALVDLSATHFGLDSYAGASYALTRAHQVVQYGLDGGFDDTNGDQPVSTALRDEVLIRHAAVQLFHSPEGSVPVTFADSSPEQVEPALRRARNTVARYGSGRLPLAAARDELHSLLSCDALNRVPFLPRELVAGLGKERPQRLQLDS
jgi:hypothetical protein